VVVAPSFNMSIKMDFFLTPRYFLVNGYWLDDDQEVFYNFVCCTSSVITTEQYRDQDVFLFDTSVLELKMKINVDFGEDYIITEVSDYLPTREEILKKKIEGFT
jgi:hypothetical protein